MRHLAILAAKSAWNRRLTLGLTLVSIALSVMLLLGVKRAVEQAHESFNHSVSGTDLIVGARTSPVQLMLYSVFRIGDATNNIRWSAYQDIAQSPMVAWTIPISLGDSHHGFPVLGTTEDYFQHFLYGDRQQLQFKAGRAFKDTFEVVIGSEVAAERGYTLGQSITLSHGMGGSGLREHADKPFTVVGILAPTGTPVDRTVHISLEAITAIHLDWVGGAPMTGFSIPEKMVHKFDLAPKEITAMLVGLKSRVAVFHMQRMVNDYAKEPLLAVMPGIALEQLWQVVSVAEKTLLLVSGMVVVVGLSGLVAVVLASLNERRRELAILRSVGARPVDVLLLLAAEGLFVTLFGTVLGVGLLTALTWGIAPWVQNQLGVHLTVTALSQNELQLLSLVIAVGFLAALVPGYRAYRLSLADGLTPRM